MAEFLSNPVEYERIEEFFSLLKQGGKMRQTWNAKSIGGNGCKGQRE
jgi:hypothetical protein